MYGNISAGKLKSDMVNIQWECCFETLFQFSLYKKTFLQHWSCYYDLTFVIAVWQLQYDFYYFRADFLSSVLNCPKDKMCFLCFIVVVWFFLFWLIRSEFQNFAITRNLKKKNLPCWRCSQNQRIRYQWAATVKCIIFIINTPEKLFIDIKNSRFSFVNKIFFKCWRSQEHSFCIIIIPIIYYQVDKKGHLFFTIFP